MGQSDTTSLAGALKRVYDKKAVTQQNLKHKALDQIAKDSKSKYVDGSGFYGAIRDYGNESVGAINETEALRSIDNENIVQFKVVPKIETAPVAITGLLAESAKRDEAAFVSALVDAVEIAKERLLSDENRQFFGLGNGLLASPTGAIASTVLSFTVDSTQYIRNNMVLDIYNGATKTIDSKRVTYVDRANNVIGFATSLSAELNATSELIKENTRDSAPTDGKEMMGLRGIVDDSTDLTTFQDINASTNREWRARVVDGTGVNLSSDLLQRVMDDIEIDSGEEIDMIVMHQKQRRKYLDIVVPQKRYMDGKLDAGFSSLSFNGKELFLEKDCQSDTVYLLNKKHLHKFELAPLRMGGIEDVPHWQRRSGYDMYEAFWIHYCNFGTDKRKAHGKIKGLNVGSGLE